jgi:hypothetical protein
MHFIPRYLEKSLESYIRYSKHLGKDIFVIFEKPILNLSVPESASIISAS